MKKRCDIHYLHIILNIAHKFTLTQGMMWNLMLNFASKNITKKEEHKISIARIIKFLNNKTSKYIKEQLLQRNMTDSACPFKYYFENIEIKNDTVYYKYPIELIQILSNKCVETITKNLIDMKFSSKFSLFLYEFLLYYELLECVHIIPLHAIRFFMGLKEKQYNNFQSFHNKIIIPALYEINTKTKLKASIKYIKEGKNVIGLKFKLKNRINYTENEQALTRNERFSFFLENIAIARFHRLSNSGKIQFNLEYEKWLEEEIKFIPENNFPKFMKKKEFLIKQCISPYEANLSLWENTTILG